MRVNAVGSRVNAESDQQALARLRAAARAQSYWWCGDRPTWAGMCQLCRGPAGAGRSRCFQCDLHAQSASGSLAGAVIPIAYAVKGGGHASDLWRYKSGRTGAAAAGRRLTVLLALFLCEHGSCLWRAVGISGPTHVGVVPSGRRRAGTHPLRSLVQPYSCLPWAELAARPGGSSAARDLDPGRFSAARLPQARVLLLDDTWTSGASAQSAAMALRRAGASTVVTVVLGRHLAAPAGAGRGPAGPDGQAGPEGLVSQYGLMARYGLRCAAEGTAAPAVGRPGDLAST